MDIFQVSRTEQSKWQSKQKIYQNINSSSLIGLNHFAILLMIFECAKESSVPEELMPWFCVCVFWNQAQKNFTHPYTEYPWVSVTLTLCNSVANKDLPHKFYLYLIIIMDIFAHYSNGGQNNEPFSNQTHVRDLNTKLVCYSDHHCTLALIFTFFKLLLGNASYALSTFVYLASIYKLWVENVPLKNLTD